MTGWASTGSASRCSRSRRPRPCPPTTRSPSLLAARPSQPTGSRAMRPTRSLRAPARRRGFTMMETISAVIILTIAVPPMMWALRESYRQRANPVLFSKGTWLAREKLEDVIADRHSTTNTSADPCLSTTFGYDSLAACNSRYNAEAAGTISGYPQFSRSVSFAETKADLSSAGGGYKKISITVGWNDANGNARTLVVAAVVTEYDPV